MARRLGPVRDFGYVDKIKGWPAFSSYYFHRNSFEISVQKIYQIKIFLN